MLLEIAGYHVQVLEFVQTADTPQNVMIAAVKKRGRGTDTAAARQRLVALAQSHGVEQQALASWMGEGLSGTQKARSPKAVSPHQMPPL